MIPKFRVWNKEVGTMHHVVSIWFDDAPHVTIPFGDSVANIFSDFELMQSTGLKDKNGVEIFEGDIVRITSFPGDWYSTIGHVIWGLDEPMSGAYPAFFIPEFESEMNSFSQIFDSGEYEIEVIGNIYEDKELLEVE